MLKYNVAENHITKRNKKLSATSKVSKSINKNDVCQNETSNINVSITGSCCRDNVLTSIDLTRRTTLKPVPVAPFELWCYALK